jgi:hypothetical protein
MPWTVDTRPADGLVLLNTHPMRAAEAFSLGVQLARAARSVHAASKRPAPPPAAPPAIMRSPAERVDSGELEEGDELDELRAALPGVFDELETVAPAPAAVAAPAAAPAPRAPRRARTEASRQA